MGRAAFHDSRGNFQSQVWEQGEAALLHKDEGGRWTGLGYTSSFCIGGNHLFGSCHFSNLVQLGTEIGELRER